jgi:hypothetical protein
MTDRRGLATTEAPSQDAGSGRKGRVKGAFVSHAAWATVAFVKA